MTDWEMDEALRQIEVPAVREEWKSKVRIQMAKKPWKRRMVVAGLAACAALGAAFHDGDLGTVSTQNDKMKVSMTMRVEPMYSRLTWMGTDSVVGGAPGWTTRVFYDRSRQEVFGYEVSVKPVGDGKFEMEFQALRQDPRDAKTQQYRWTGVNALPAKRVVGQSEAVQVELKQEGSARLLEAVAATGSFEPIEVSMRKAPMRLLGAKLFVDGELVIDEKGGGVSGARAVLWFPGEKNIKLGLDEGPKQEMVPVGWVDGAVLEFDMDGHHYRIVGSEAISDGGRRTVYGVSKPNDQPKGPAGFGTEG